MGADVPAMQGASVSATVILIMLNWNNSVPARQRLRNLVRQIMVHTSLEKSWNFNLALKSPGISCWPGKMTFCVEKSLKINEKYKFEEVGYFSYMITMRLLTPILKYVAIRK